MKLCCVVLLCVALQGVSIRAAENGANPLMGSTRPSYDQIKDYILRSVDQMPEAHYSFRPTPDVRTFGQLIAHIATMHYQFCSAALVEANPDPRDFEKTHTTKAQIADVIRASFRYCDSAYEMSDAQATKYQSIPGWGERAPLSILVMTISHDNQHYGNMVTYMRMEGLVPPSSQASR